MKKGNLRPLILIVFLLPLFLSSASLPTSVLTDPVTTDHFQVQWGGNNMAFDAVEGLESHVEIIEYRDGYSPDYAPSKLPGSVHFNNIILRRRIQKNDNELWQWYAYSLKGKPEYRDLTISVLDREHVPVITYKISTAWPCAYRGPVLAGGDRQVAMEEIEIACHAMTVENN